MPRRLNQPAPSFAFAAPSSRADVDFSQFDGRSIALSLPVGGESRVFCGSASHELDESLGAVLRITLAAGPATGNAQIIISQSSWNGRIIPDLVHGCDFLFLAEA